MSKPPLTAELIEDRGEAAAERGVLPLPSRFSTPRASPTRCAFAGEDRELLAPLIVREIGGRTRARRDLPLRISRESSKRSRLPGAVLRRLRHLDPESDRLLGDRPGHGLRPPHPRRAAACRRQRAQRRPDRRPGAAAEEPRQRPQPDQQEPAPRLRGADRPRPGDDRRRARRLPRRLRADDAPHRRRRALLLRRRLLRPHPRLGSDLARARRSPPDGEIAAASIAARSDGFLHYYLSGSADSHLRDSPMKNVVAALVEPLRRAGAAAQPRRRHRPRRPARGVQARLRQPRAALAHLGDRLRRGGLRAPLRRPRARRLLPRLPRAG